MGPCYGKFVTSLRRQLTKGARVAAMGVHADVPNSPIKPGPPTRPRNPRRDSSERVKLGRGMRCPPSVPFIRKSGLARQENKLDLKDIDHKYIVSISSLLL